MADRVLEASIRAALEGLMKQREFAQNTVDRQRSAVNSAAHLLEKAKESLSSASREENEKIDHLRVLTNLANSKTTDQRSNFQGGLAHLEVEQIRATHVREQQEQIVLAQEKEHQKEIALLKYKQDDLVQVVTQISALQNELQEALR